MKKLRKEVEKMVKRYGCPDTYLENETNRFMAIFRKKALTIVKDIEAEIKTYCPYEKNKITDKWLKTYFGNMAEKIKDEKG